MARLIAGLARIAGDVGVAEDLAQDALPNARERELLQARAAGRR